MNTERVRKFPPAGPSSAPTTSSSNHGIAPGSTNAGSIDVAIARAQTLLVSNECCHVGLAVGASSGFTLRKCVVTCCGTPKNVSNKVACGATNLHAAPPELAGRQT